MTGTRFEDVSLFNSDSIARLSKTLFGTPKGLTTMEDVAQSIVTLIWNSLKESESAPSQCALVRLFKTCDPAELPGPLRSAVIQGDDSFRSLALLGTYGDEPDWNSRLLSKAHQVIPLESAEIVEKIPMISNLIKMLGLNLHEIVKPNPELSVAGFYPLSVFYVEEAQGSDIIPAQQNFAVPFGIRSVIGFGGLLNYSDMFTVIMFLKVPVSREIAALFKDMAEVVYHLLLPFQQNGQVFRTK